MNQPHHPTITAGQRHPTPPQPLTWSNSGGRVRIEQGGAFYLEVNGGGTARSQVAAIRLDRPARPDGSVVEAATAVQVRHIASHVQVEGFPDARAAKECPGWSWAAPGTAVEDGSYTIEIGLFPECPSAVVIVSSTDPAALLPTLVDYTVTARESTTGTAVEDLGGHGIAFRVAGPFTGQDQVQVEVDLGDDGFAAGAYDPRFCVYAAAGLPEGALGAVQVDGVGVGGEFVGEGSTGAGRYRASSSDLTRYCIDMPPTVLGGGLRTFAVEVSEPVSLDAAFVSLHRTDYCVSPEPWKTDYPECVQAQGGNVVAWGHDTTGELGPNTSEEWATAAAPVGVENAVAVAGGLLSGYALGSDGTVWAWGHNGYGQLGDGTTVSRSTPARVVGLTDIVQIDARGYNAYALRADGTVWTWGSTHAGVNPNYQGVFILPFPRQVLGIGNATSIAAGPLSATAVLSDGSVVGWGNTEGALNNTCPTVCNLPTTMVGLTDVTQVALDTNGGYALREDGTVLAWGRHNNGRLGNGTDLWSPVPRPVIGIDRATAIAAGQSNGYALLDDGSLWAWGRSYGVGTGTSTDAYAPVRIPTLSNVVAIDASSRLAAALLADGTVRLWGDGSAGLFARGLSPASYVPAPVAGLTGVTAIAVGYESAYALTNTTAAP